MYRHQTCQIWGRALRCLFQWKFLIFDIGLSTPYYLTVNYLDIHFQFIDHFHFQNTFLIGLKFLESIIYWKEDFVSTRNATFKRTRNLVNNILTPLYLLPPFPSFINSFTSSHWSWKKTRTFNDARRHSWRQSEGSAW